MLITKLGNKELENKNARIGSLYISIILIVDIITKLYSHDYLYP